MSTKEYLSKLGFTMNEANAFIMGNLSSPEIIYNTVKSVGVTSEMLAEIVELDVSASDVVAWFDAQGFDGSALDTDVYGERAEIASTYNFSGDGNAKYSLVLQNGKDYTIDLGLASQTDKFLISVQNVYSGESYVSEADATTLSFTSQSTSLYNIDLIPIFSATSAASHSLSIQPAGEDDDGVMQIQTDQVISGDLINASETETYQVTLTAGNTYVVNLLAEDSGLGTLVDPHLTISGNNNLSHFDDDSGKGLESLITFTPTVSGTYDVDVGGYSGGTYSLLVSTADDSGHGDDNTDSGTDGNTDSGTDGNSGSGDDNTDSGTGDNNTDSGDNTDTANEITLAAGSSGTVDATSESDIFVLDITAAEALDENTVLTINGFDVTNDKLKLDLDAATPGETNVANLVAANEVISAEINPFVNSVVIHFGPDNSGDGIFISVVGTQDASAIEVTAL
ncbi:hypothetical protein [Oceanospirillum sediminis]|uniref:Peptidase C-terminal archaeal/bacterial domain-containing protein n=1 Tax=Oceanospirillum sediminis TaxID=2760088 RepID=A0A839IXL2_9GAMM|nr:hypothetical protein [Oceanospirillum sediminis]MBB1489117.1 hypothetical protein [Oceanospirillum sediminis]